MTIGGDQNSNINAGQIVSESQATGAIIPQIPASFSNSVAEAALLNQLASMTDVIPSSNPEDGTPEADGGSTNGDSFFQVGEKGQGSGGQGSGGQGEGGSDNEGKGGPNGQGVNFIAIQGGSNDHKGGGGGDSGNSDDTGYDSSQLQESSSGAVAELMAKDLEASFTQADYAKDVARDSIEDAQQASTGALDMASEAASYTKTAAVDQADAQITQSVGSLAGALGGAAFSTYGYFSEENQTNTQNLNNHIGSNTAFSNYKQTPPYASRPDIPPPEAGATVYERNNGVINSSYNPVTSDVKLNTSAEYSQSELGDPAADEPGPVYSQEEYNNYYSPAHGGPDAIADGTDINGFTKEQKLAALNKDAGKTPDQREYQFPEGTYSTAQRQQVMAGKSISNDADGTTTKSILQDAKDGGHTLPTSRSPEMQAQITDVQTGTFVRPGRPADATKPTGQPSDNSVTRSGEGIAQKNTTYDPKDPDSPPLSSREIDINPTTNGGKVTYSASDRAAFEKWNNSSISKRTSSNPLQDEDGGPTAAQKQAKIEEDIKNGTTTNQRPDGWYNSHQRAYVADEGSYEADYGEKPPITAEQTRAIQQDLRMGGFKDSVFPTTPDPTKGTAGANYDSNGIAIKNDAPGTPSLGTRNQKLSQFHEFSQDELGVDEKGNLKEQGPVYTKQERAQYLKAQSSGMSDGITDDDVNGISAANKRVAIQKDIDGENKSPSEESKYMFPENSYTTRDRQVFSETGVLSNDPGGSRRTTILKDLQSSGSSDEIQQIRSKSDIGFQKAVGTKAEVMQRYSSYSSIFQGALTGVTGIGAAQLNIEGAQAKQTADLDTAAAQQLSSVQSMDMNQGMGIASAAINAAMNSTKAISDLLSAVIRNQ